MSKISRNDERILLRGIQRDAEQTVDRVEAPGPAALVLDEELGRCAPRVRLRSRGLR